MTAEPTFAPAVETPSLVAPPAAPPAGDGAPAATPSSQAAGAGPSAPPSPIYGEGFVKRPVPGTFGRSCAHIPVAFGVGRSAPSQPTAWLRSVPSAAYPQSPRQREIHPRDFTPETVLPTATSRAGADGTSTLNHLCGIVLEGTSPEKNIRRTPPFKRPTVADGSAVMVTVGVVLLSRHAHRSYSTNLLRNGVFVLLVEIKPAPGCAAAGSAVAGYAARR